MTKKVSVDLLAGGVGRVRERSQVKTKSELVGVETSGAHALKCDIRANSMLSVRTVRGQVRGRHEMKVTRQKSKANFWNTVSIMSI